MKQTCGKSLGMGKKKRYLIKVRRCEVTTREYQATRASYLRWCRLCNHDAMVKKSKTFNVVSGYFYNDF